MYICKEKKMQNIVKHIWFITIISYNEGYGEKEFLMIRGEGGSSEKCFSMIKGGGGVQAPPKKHDIINEQPLNSEFSKARN